MIRTNSESITRVTDTLKPNADIYATLGPYKGSYATNNDDLKLHLNYFMAQRELRAPRNRDG